jgi:hypothetical protein
METQIKETLIQLLDGINRSDAASILRGLEALDAHLETGRGKLHPQLIHYLEGRSYAKALAWLGGDSGIPVGSCAPRRSENR